MLTRKGKMLEAGLELTLLVRSLGNGASYHLRYSGLKANGVRGKGKACALTSTHCDALRGNNVQRASHA